MFQASLETIVRPPRPEGGQFFLRLAPFPSLHLQFDLVDLEFLDGPLCFLRQRRRFFFALPPLPLFQVLFRPAV